MEIQISINIQNNIIIKLMEFKVKIILKQIIYLIRIYMDRIQYLKEYINKIHNNLDHLSEFN
jgi:hypothetical protein